MGARLGGWFTHQWGATYPKDSVGPCSAEVAGMGLTDSIYSPFCLSRSAGIRQAHGSTSFENVGQLNTNALLLGK